MNEHDDPGPAVTDAELEQLADEHSGGVDEDLADYDPDHPDLQHELPEHEGESTTDPHDLDPPEGVETDPGELPSELGAS
jgi:hypothetical protein